MTTLPTHPSDDVFSGWLAWAAERGWSVFSVDHPSLPQCAGIKTKAHDPATCTERGKHPCVAFSKRATSEPARVAAMFNGQPRNYGIYCGGSGLLVVDEDDLGCFEKWASEHGHTIPVTLIVNTREGRRHYYFTVPSDFEHHTKAGVFTDLPIDIRAGNAYVVGPGSLHATGVFYSLAVDPDTPVAPAPDWLLAAVKGERARAESNGVGGAVSSLEAFYGQPTTYAWPEPETVRPGGMRQRDDLLSASSSLASRGVDDEQAMAVLLERMSRYEVGEPDNPWTVEHLEEFWKSAKRKYPAAQRPEPASSRDGQPAVSPPPLLAPVAGLPAEFWVSRPWLMQVRDAAWSRGCAAESVFGAFAARIAARSPYWAKLPAIRGSQCGLTLWTVLVGHSGSGKSSSPDVAAELVDRGRIHTDCDMVSPGSGEGIIELLFGLEDDPDHPTKKIRRQVHWNAPVYADEGLVLTAHKARWSTLLDIMRSAYSDATLGQANATEERKRIVPAGRYSYGFVFSVQMEHADFLLNEDEIIAGTPQRVIWSPADAPTPEPVDEPDWPGPLPEVPDLKDTRPAGGSRLTLAVDPAVVAEVKANHRYRRRYAGDPLDSQRDLTRLKLAGGVFAQMDGRWRISQDDWRLAGMVMDLSDATRARALARIADKRKRGNIATGVARGAQDAVARTVEADEIEQVVRRKLAGKLTSEWATIKEFRDPLRPYERPHCESVMAGLVDDGLAEAREREYQPGKFTTEFRRAG